MGFKPPIHFHCVLHAKRGRGGGVLKACKIAYVLNGRPLRSSRFQFSPLQPVDKTYFQTVQI